MDKLREKSNWKRPGSVIARVPKPYHAPDFQRFCGKFTGNARNFIRETNAGQFNAQFAVPELKSQLNLALDELEKQRVEHQYTIYRIGYEKETALHRLQADKEELEGQREELIWEKTDLLGEGVRLPAHRHFLSSPVVQLLFVLGCISADSFTLYTVFDLLLTQAVTLTLVITATISAILNIIPVLGGALIRNEEMASGMKKAFGALLLTVFLLLFGACFALRYTSRDLLFTDSVQLSIFDDEEEETEENPTAAENILAVLIGLEPLATSTCCFFLSCEADPKSKQRKQLEEKIHRLSARIDHISAQIHELQADMKFDLEADDFLKLRQARETAVDMAVWLLIQSLMLLSAAEAQPEAVYRLLEGGSLTQEEISNTYEKLSEDFYATFDARLAFDTL